MLLNVLRGKRLLSSRLFYSMFYGGKGCCGVNCVIECFTGEEVAVYVVDCFTACRMGGKGCCRVECFAGCFTSKAPLGYLCICPNLHRST